MTMGGRPLALLRWLLRRVIPPRYRDQVEGDVEEGYRRRREDGVWWARVWAWRQLLSADVLHLRRACRGPARRRPRRTGVMTGRELWHDTTFALRSMGKHRGFTAVVLGTLALGIGANAAIFSVVNAVLLTPLPYPKAEELTLVFRTVPRFGFERSTASFPDFRDWRSETTTFSTLAAYGRATATYLAADGAERWSGVRATSDVLPMFGVTPVVGRVFLAADDAPGAPPVVLLSYGRWQSRFGGDPGIVGTTVTFDDVPYTIIGVLPPHFEFPSRTVDYWVPLQGDADRMERDTNFLSVIGRRAAGVTIADAQAELRQLAARIDADAPQANEGYGVFVESLHAYMVRNARTALWVFLGAVGLVLVIACVNVLNLMLARGTSRTRELAVRSVLGAGRGRLIRQLLTESAVYGLLGGGLGVLVAVGLVRLLVVTGPADIPRLDEVRVDPLVLTVTAGLSILSALVFGTVPALHASRGDAGQWLRDGGRVGGLGRWGRRLQESFVVAQVALAVILSIGAGLLVNSFLRLTSVDLGFDPGNVVAARVASPRFELDPTRPDSEMQAAMMAATAVRVQFFDELLRRMQAAPGVQAAGLLYALPLSGSNFSRVLVPEGMSVEPGDAPVIAGNVVVGDVFGALGISLLRGRGLTAADGAEEPSVALVDENLASLFWPGEDPIGKRMRIGDGDRPWTTVVGIVAAVRHRNLTEEPPPTYYRPLAQAAWPDGMYMAVRTTGDFTGIVSAIRREVRALNPEAPVTNIVTVSDLIDQSVASPRFRTGVLTAFGTIALTLALVGVYGVMAHAVGDRRHEIGIRLALGAERGMILGLVLKTGVGMAAIGLSLGLAGAAGLTRFLENMLFQLTPYDPWTFAAVVTIVILVSGAASLLPARHASRIDPMQSLRGD